MKITLPCTLSPGCADEADERLWLALWGVVQLLNVPAASIILLIEAGELRAREDDTGIHVLVEDLLAFVRRQLDAARAAVAERVVVA